MCGWKNASSFVGLAIFFPPLKANFCFQGVKPESCSRVLRWGWLKHPWKMSSPKELSGLFSLQDPAAGPVFPGAGGSSHGKGEILTWVFPTACSS